MSIVLPDPARIEQDKDSKGADASTVDHLQRLNVALTKEIERLVPKNQAVAAMYLQSPGGRVYSVTVTDGGALVTTLLYQP